MRHLLHSLFEFKWSDDNNIGRCLKRCSFSVPQQIGTNTFDVQSNDSEREVFLKTLAFYCAVIERGCPFVHVQNSEDRGNGDSGSDSDMEMDSEDTYKVFL